MCIRDRFTPVDDFTGSIQIPYTVDDGSANNDTATITINVFDNPPVVEDDINTAEINQSVAGNVLTNDQDPNPGDDLAVVDPATGVAATNAVTLTTTGGGTVVINPDGSYVYTPATEFVGEDTFMYSAADENGNANGATVSIEVRDRNVPVDPADPSTLYNAQPIASNDSFTLFTDSPLESSVTGNDSDPDGDVITIATASGLAATAPQTVTTEQGGAVVLNTDGSFTYTPPAGFLGQDSFDYSIVDTGGVIDSASVTLNVVADSNPSENNDPQANNDLVSVPVGESATTNLLDNDTDLNGDPLTITQVDGVDPSVGPISIVDPITGEPAGSLVVDAITGEATFTPEPGYTGTVQLPYTIDDGAGGTDAGTLTFQINDTSPTAEDDTNITEAELPVTGNVLTNDHDDNPADSITIADPATGSAASGPVTVSTENGGTVVFNLDGSYEYTPAAGYAGVDTFVYTGIDTFGKTDDAIVAITVRGTGDWSVTGPDNSDEGSTPQFIVSLTGTYGEGEMITVDLDLTDSGTNSGDYADVIAAITAAVSENPDVTFNPATGTLTYTSPSDSSAMANLIIDLPLTDDGLVEGPEEFSFGLSNATSSTGGLVAIDPDGAVSTTIINDTQGAGGTTEGPGLWSVSGPANSDEGSTAQFTVSLTGTYGEGEILTVDFGLTDIGTNSSDYADLLAAIEAAVAGNPDVSFNPATGTLEYTSPADGSSMTDIVIDLVLTDDGLIEGPEELDLGLSNAGSSTGANVVIDPAAGAISTTINDTRGSNGPSEEPGQWSVAGPAEGSEGTTPEFTVSLTGEYGEGEIITVELGLSENGNNSVDYEDLVAAINAAVADNPDVSFDPVTGIIEYTSPADGSSMADIVIGLALIDDGLLEGSEDFTLSLSNAASSTDAGVELDETSASLTTTIIDAQGPGGVSETPGQWSVTGPAETVEGSTPQFVISLTGEYGEGEIVTVDLGFTDVETTTADHSDFVAAITAAVASNPNATFDPETGTLKFISPADGASLTDIVIDFALTDDGLIETPETFSMALTNAGSSTGCLLYTSPSPRDRTRSRMPSSA